MLGKEYERQDCSIARALEVIGERWTLLIVRDAFYGVRRFTDFHAHLDIPKAVLSDRLSGLVEEGVLERHPDPGHAGRQLYELTAAGRDLWPVIHSLLVWGDRHRAPNSRFFRHGECGTELDDRGACPACGVTPVPQDIVSERRGRRALRGDPVSKVLSAPRRLLDPIEA
jgi:DNA-binding HxlR family transcriptional regulator